MQAIILLALGAWTLGCGGGGAGSVAPLAPPPPSITVSVTPNSGTVLLGETLNFTAAVSNSSDTAVIWSVNGVSGGSPQAGTISADGLYTAPPDLPSGGTVQVTATSHADSSKSATASVTVSSDISISLSQTMANVELGAQQSFQATIQSQGPAQFDGSYLIEHLPVGHSYSIYAEALDRVPSTVSTALTTLCRNTNTDPRWPTAQACVVPTVNQQFTTRALPAP